MIGMERPQVSVRRTYSYSARVTSARSDSFLDRARAAQAAQPTGRLALPEFVSWPTFPFDGELLVKPIGDLVVPEPPRHGEGGIGCHACEAPDSEYLWADRDWRVQATDRPTGLPVVLLLEPREHHDLADLPEGLLDSLGRMIFTVERAVLSLGGIARVQVTRWGDGAEHLHFWFFPRPEGFVQGRGSFLAEWDDVLPPRPEAEWRQTLADLSRALGQTGSGG